MSAASDLGNVLRDEAVKIANVRNELRDSDADRDDRLARDLRDASELVRVLARMVEGKSIYEAFGAPGDFGYETPIGSALYRYYQKAQA
jgi:hypothetical protein